MAARAIPAVWELITPAEALRVRQAGAVSALRGPARRAGLGDERRPRTCSRAAGELDCAGRVLAAANAALPSPEDATGRLWQGATVLREHRGDGHFAAVATADIDGARSWCCAAAWTCGARTCSPSGAGPTSSGTRPGAAGRPGLDRPDGTLPPRAVPHAALENATDQAAARPWTRLGPSAVTDLAGVLTPMPRACARVVPYPSPIGVPAPDGAHVRLTPVTGTPAPSAVRIGRHDWAR